MSSNPRPPSPTFEALLAACSAPGRLSVLVDFDGTLAEPPPQPADATARPGSLAALARLVRVGVDVAVVSGRRLDDLAPRLPLEGVWLAGQHGGELLDPAGARVELVASRGVRPLLERFLAHARRVAATRDLLVEDQGLGVLVHTRGLAATEAREVVHALWLDAREHSAAGSLLWQVGSSFVELRARGADKGRAAEHLLAQWRPSTCVAFGDDGADEGMFAAVARHRGVAVKVGPGPTAARHRLEGPEALEAFLLELAERRAGVGAAEQAMTTGNDNGQREMIS